MKFRGEMYWARWLLLPCSLWALLVVVPCSLAFIKRRYLQSADTVFWHNADFWVSCLTGAVCGFAWVFIAYALAPSRKLTVAVVSCIPGGQLAWLLICEAHYYCGDSYRISQSFVTNAPLHLCWWAGAVGLCILWRSRRQASRSVGQLRKTRRAVGVMALVLACLVFCTFVVPSTVAMWRFTLYQSAMSAITKGGEAEAIRTVHRLVKAPLFDLDWTPGSVLSLIPFGEYIDSEAFGCPTCRGIHRPLLYAVAAQGHTALLRKMLAWRGSPDYCGDGGQTVLAAAISSHDTNTVALLLSYGVKAAATNAYSYGALHLAVMTRAPEGLMTMLLEAGAPVNTCAGNGMTPLDCATIWEPDAIPFLLNHGASNAVVRVHMIPVPGVASQFRFEGSPFGIHLPPGFSPVNRLATPQDCRAWELRTVDGGYLRFSIGKVTTGRGAEMNFNGYAAAMSYDENIWRDGTWSAHGSIVFDSTGHTHEALKQLGRTPRYDAAIEYMALRREDLRRIQHALQSLGRLAEPTQQTGTRDDAPAAQAP